MKSEIIQSLTNDFESFAKQPENGVEFWLARDLQRLLGYEQWKNFKTVIDKTRTACEVARHDASNHFADVGKTIKMPKGAEKTIDDFMLTGYTCYLIAQNGDRVISPITKASGTRYLKEASDRKIRRPVKT